METRPGDAWVGLICTYSFVRNWSNPGAASKSNTLNVVSQDLKNGFHYHRHKDQ